MNLESYSPYTWARRRMTRLSPGIRDSSCSASSFTLASLSHGFSLSCSVLGARFGAYTMPVLTSTNDLTPRFSASFANVTLNCHDRSLYISGVWDQAVSPAQLKT